MATKVSFINYSYLVDNSPIYGNLDPQDINWIIPISQDSNIERLLGTALYDKLKADIVASGTTAGAYKVLLDDYINPALAFYVATDALAFNAVKFTNKGLLMKSSENSEQASEEAYNRYKDNLEKFAEYYGNRLVKHLCANTSTYPEYLNAGDDAETIHPADTAYKATFYIPNKNRKK